MAILRKRRIGKKHFYYIEHSYKTGKKVKIFSKYLGRKRPENVEELKKDIEFEVMRMIWKKPLITIKKAYAKELRRLPETARRKRIESFMVEFIYNSDKIEGSKLSYKDTADLFIHGETPRNKPLKDVKEAEGHKKAFYDMLKYKGALNLKEVCQWHNMIFEDSDSGIAGKIRLHNIIVTGSRVVFPHPESLNKLLKEFFLWYKNNEKRYNPAEFAALAHLRFVTIHPFTDGNGRISRLIANYALHKNRCPLINIKFSDRKAYYSSLETSQLREDEKHFIRFFVKRYIKANKGYLRK